MVDEPKTVVPGNETPPVPATVQTPPSPAVDTSGNQTGLENRLAGLVAQNARKDEALAKLTADFEALKAKTMSDSEKALADAQAKAVDNFKASDYEPVKQRLEQVEAALRAKLDILKGELNEQQLAKIPPGLTVDTELAFVEAIAESPKQKAATVGGAISPVSSDPDTRMYSQVEFREWQHMASSPDPTVRAEWAKMRDTMNKAYREGRVERT
jgi:molecular chaperone GrpE (heat shock protein)